jgi:hypothetical protein
MHARAYSHAVLTSHLSPLISHLSPNYLQEPLHRLRVSGVIIQCIHAHTHMPSSPLIFTGAAASLAREQAVWRVVNRVQPGRHTLHAADA